MNEIINKYVGTFIKRSINEKSIKPVKLNIDGLSIAADDDMSSVGLGDFGARELTRDMRCH